MIPFTVRQGEIDLADPARFISHIRVIAERNRCHVVCIDAEKVAGKEHVERAVKHALRSWGRGQATASNLEMEVLLYTAGTRQTGIAREFGAHAGTNRLYFCFFPPSENAIREVGACISYTDESWDGIDSAKQDRLMALFGISRAEVEAVGEGRFRDLVLERVALLEVYK